MSEQQTPRPEDAPTADALESVAVTESGPAPAATQDGPAESTSDMAAGSPDSTVTAEPGAPTADTTEGAAPETPAEQAEVQAEQAGTTTAPPAADASTEPSAAPAEHSDVPANQVQTPAEQSDVPAERVEATTERVEFTTEHSVADAPADQVQTPAAQRDVAAEHAEASAEQAEAPAEQPVAGAPTEPSVVPAEQTETPAEQSDVPSEQVEATTEPLAADAPAEQAEATAEQTEATAEQTEAPGEQAETTAEQADAPAEQVETPAEQADAPAEQVETPAEQTSIPAHQAQGTTEPPAADAPAEQAETPAEQTAVPAGQVGEPSTVEPGGTIEADAAQAARPSPAAVPKPGSVPKPSSPPKPSALPRRGPGTPAPTPVVVAPVLDDSKEAAAAAAWGRVDPDGTVWVREAAGERTVGQYTGADSEEALAFYVRRFLDLQAQVVLFETRLPQLQTKEIDQTIATLAEALTEPAAVGDIDGLRARLETLRERAKERRKEISAEREAAKAQALAERTVIVERAEAISATDPEKVHWRSAGEELRSLLEEWKHAQRTGPRLDRPTEDALWKRFSRARTTFDRNRGHYFSQLDAAQAEVKRVKEQLIAEAEALSTSTDWGRTSASYRELMDKWKAAGRASRKEDDALWARFRAARQRFFEAREAQNAEIDAEYTANLEVKLTLLEQAEALLPVKDPEAAKAALRPIQDRWDQAGKVPRADVQRVEARMRAVEQAVREADQERWSRSDPEKKARAEGAAAQLYESIEALERQLADARSAGDQRAEKQAAEALEARKAWLDQVLRAAGS